MFCKTNRWIFFWEAKPCKSGEVVGERQNFGGKL